jgi:sulfotransferase family protein
VTIIIGGSGSVGSTLLATVLNRHEDMFCGPELSLFNKEVAFTDWAAARRMIREQPKRFVTHGWGPYSGTGLSQDDYCWDKLELDGLLSTSNSLVEFTRHFFEKPLAKEGKHVWVEKTPSNSFCFSEFLDTFEDPRVVHITRNPLDTVLSLVNRGFTPIYAAGIWVYNCAMALRSRESIFYHELKYEDLTSRPEEVLRGLIDFLGVSPDQKLLAATEDGRHIKTLDSWTLSPSDAIKPRNARSFEQAPDQLRKEIRTALTVFRVSEKHQRRFDTPAVSCEEVSALLGYTFDPYSNKTFSRSFSFAITGDVLRRTIRGYETGFLNYPGTLRW